MLHPNVGATVVVWFSFVLLLSFFFGGLAFAVTTGQQKQ